MSPASGNRMRVKVKSLHAVSFISIQLMSPASGNGKWSQSLAEDWDFHSINVPSEWELIKRGWVLPKILLGDFHSINVPSEWEHKGHKLTAKELISFPFN